MDNIPSTSSTKFDDQSGYPLQYGCAVTSTFWTDYYSYPIGRYMSQQTVEMSEEVLMPLHTNDSQSDSENSESSVEILKPIDGSRTQVNSDDLKCCWKSCGLWFRSLDKLSNHITKFHAASGPGGLFYCGWEGCTRNLRGFNARYKMLVHVRTHTNERPHQCTKCQKSFSRAENLKIHLRSHSGEKPYVCPVPGCNKAYSNSSDRFKHTRTHQVEKPYSCKIPGCLKRYTDPSSLRKHVKTYRHIVDLGNQKEEEIKEQTNEKNTTDQLHYIQMDALSPTLIHENILPIDSLYINQKEYCDNSINGVCKCTHACSYLNSGAKQILNFNTVLDSKETNVHLLPSWRQFWNSNIQINRNSEKTFFINELKESDMPLDLSIRH